MRTFKPLLIAAALSFLAPVAAHAASIVFVNEVDYDQLSTDTAEYIELAGTAGTSLNGWKMELVNGNDNTVYKTILLPNFTFTDETATGWGFFLLGSSNVTGTDATFSGTTDQVQNGAPDGIRILDGSNAVVQFLSYEGNMPGDTETSSASDNNSTAGSIYKTGTGNASSDFTWTFFADSTPGALNTGQTLTAPPVPLPASALAGGSLLSLLALSRRRLARPM